MEHKNAEAAQRIRKRENQCGGSSQSRRFKRTASHEGTWKSKANLGGVKYKAGSAVGDRAVAMSQGGEEPQAALHSVRETLRSARDPSQIEHCHHQSDPFAASISISLKSQHGII